jgi:hypothetical protein
MARTRRPLDKALLTASFVFALGLALIGFAFASAETGRDAQGLPEAIDLIAPESGDEVLRQSSVVADLAPGFEGRLIIDQRELETQVIAIEQEVEPGQQLNQDVLVTRFDPGSGTLTYQPQEGAPIESFAAGTHEVTVIYWPITDPDAARSFTWQFRVTA